jgi:WD40 repeat protein
MAELSAEATSLAGGVLSSPRDGPVLRGVPFGKPLMGHAGAVYWGAWGLFDGRPVLATGGGDGTVRLWDPELGTALFEPLTGHVGGVYWGAWGLVDGRWALASGSNDATVLLFDPGRGIVRLWDRGSAMMLGGPLPGEMGAVLWGAWGQVGGRPALVAGGDDGMVRLWDPLSGVPIGKPLVGHAGEVRWGGWGRVGGQPVLATCGGDGTVRLWDPEHSAAIGEPLRSRLGLPVQWGAWGLADGRPVLAANSLGDGPVRLWDPERGAVLGEPLTGNRGTSAPWGAWGRVGGRPVLAIGTGSGTVRLWDPERGAARGDPLTGHTSWVLWGSWARIGNRPVLATGTDGDGTVRLWDPEHGTALGEPLTGHIGRVSWGTWGTVGERAVLATGGGDGIVRLWEVIEDRAVARLPLYQSDVTAPVDELSRLGDAVAVAEFMTAATARPPLAVGLFGDWGEGKTHFLGLLEQQVAAVARPGNPLACSAVRQVRFNAWHYAETDLWASLVAELFAQLAVAPDGGDAATEHRRQSRLAAELVEQRGLREQLQAARKRRDDLQQALRRAERDDLGSWEALTEEQRQLMVQLYGDRAEGFYRETARTAATLRETGRGSWRLLRSLRPTTVAWLAGSLGVVVAAAVAVAWVIPSVARWPVTATAVAAVLTVVEVARRLRAGAAREAGRAWKVAVQMSEGQRQGLQTEADVAAAEVTALEREVQDLTAAGQLAGIVAERAASGTYRGQLGMMTQIRQDFTNMATLLAEAAAARSTGSSVLADPGDSGEASDAQVGGTDEAGDTLPRIDRIILYIDDLDRCPPARVVEMLEAIHLLLAVPLFVTVVAVDPRWLLGAIAVRYREILQGPAAAASLSADTGPVDPDDEELWKSTPSQYLEKIFQVVLNLPPMETGGYQRLLHTLVATRADQPAATAAATPAGPLPSSVNSGVDGAGDSRDDGTVDLLEDSDKAGMFGMKLPFARVVERVDPLTLEPEERALLDLLGPPLLVSTPRGVKRLANSYGLLTAIRRDHRAADLAEHRSPMDGQAAGEVIDVAYRPYRAGMTLLAALIAYPALGPALFLHLHYTASAHPGQTWGHFLGSLQPAKGTAGWDNPADHSMSPVRAQQWQALREGLEHVTQIASEHELPLPQPLSAWFQWVVPVGRLSFPTGRIVSGLDRQRPLPE